MRSSRLLISILATVIPALGLLVAYSPVASAGSATARPETHAAAAARAALRHLAIGQHSADQRVSGRTRHIKGLTKVDSNNWSGYADTGSNYSTVTGSWTEPSVSCTSTTSLAAFWVGIDGFTSGSVEQDGTLAECYRGAQQRYPGGRRHPAARRSHQRFGGPQQHQLHPQGDRLNPVGRQLHHHSALLELRKFERRVDR
jgi:hypothetical protein